MNWSLSTYIFSLQNYNPKASTLTLIHCLVHVGFWVNEANEKVVLTLYIFKCIAMWITRTLDCLVEDNLLHFFWTLW